MDSVTDTTLGTTNVTQTDQFRTYTLQSNVNGGFLQFAGNVGGTTKNLLVLRADSDSTNTDENYVYASRLRLGNTSLTGTSSQVGYKMPEFPANQGDGKIFVSGSFDGDSGDVNFFVF